MVVAEVLRCPVCNQPRDLSPEHTRRIIQGRAPMTACRTCRTSRRRKPSAEDYAYWTSRFSMEELRALGEAIWR